MNRRRPYEMNLLNDLHEIVPEFLYDTEIATSPTLRFFQNRIAHMFPEFHRQRGFYLREQADSRRAAATIGRGRPSRMTNPSIPTRAVPVTHPSTAFTPPQVSLPTMTTPIIQTWESLQNSTYDLFLRNLLLSIVNDNNAPPSSSSDDDEVVTPPPAAATEPGRTVRHILRTARGGIHITIPGEDTGGWWDPVVVRPSTLLYQRNTEIIDASGVSLETNCSICQSHTLEDLSGAAAGTTWRRIRQCGHMFHTSCIDRWFSQNIHCPLCRTDIRTLISTASASAPSAPSATSNVSDVA